MANPTYTLISTQTVGAGGAASVTFSSIPQTYTDLVVKASARGTNASIEIDMNLSINGSASNFSWRLLQGNGTVASSANGTAAGRTSAIDAANATASTFSNTELYIPNYTSTTAKSISVDSVYENNATQVADEFSAMLWNPGTQAAITSLTFVLASGNLAQYSSFSLYGISKQ